MDYISRIKTRNNEGITMFDNRKQILTLKAENLDLLEKVALQRSNVSHLESKIKETTEKLDKAETAITKIKKEREKLKTMVREQTGADLLINALKSIGVISETAKTDYFNEVAKLQAMASSAQQMNSGYSRCNGLIGQAGLAGSIVRGGITC